MGNVPYSPGLPEGNETLARVTVPSSQHHYPAITLRLPPETALIPRHCLIIARQQAVHCNSLLGSQQEPPLSLGDNPGGPVK